MDHISATKARANLYRLIDDVGRGRKPVTIAGKKSSAVLVAEEDWNAIQETLYLLSIPGMRASVRKGLKTPLHACAKDAGW